ncbi:SDR family NAD(P)-dependent oxidoreductase [Amycolatopsis sp. H20-H5]|uniref:SDR family NAD(P)-dependent oxidoreductase n=1 Tax=Amycolatopsis sp. H20-H5 TaxID=3046309 RepID=UPI002DB7162C|nr:SDR family NAD(P)-dependent oxidoreductase [Amycolatopsis sp. H20-H5]MEC3978028.1 SDR family NAD(P)-dependent oxidoreductase [Amycolatopsis sp. H20-H5]
MINNAGSGHVGTLEQETIDDVRAVMEVNFFGVLTVTRAALPHLRASSGRVVTVTSVGGVVGQPLNEAYFTAKFAVEGFIEPLAPVAASAGVRVVVVVVEPGAVASDFISNTGVDTFDTAEAGPYAITLRSYLDRTLNAFAGAQTRAEAAASIVAVLCAESPAFRSQTSDQARGLAGIKLADLDGAAVQRVTGSWLA